jgi:thiol:disulfide interchange protein DsbC
MFKKVLIVSSLIITAVGGSFSINEQALANNTQAPDTLAKSADLDSTQLNIDILKAKIKTKLGLTIIKVEKTPVPGIALLITDQGLFY